MRNSLYAATLNRKGRVNVNTLAHETGIKPNSMLRALVDLRTQKGIQYSYDAETGDIVFGEDVKYNQSTEFTSPMSKKQAAVVFPTADATFCPYCGHKTPAGSQFCENCGSQLTIQPSQPPVQPPPPPVEPPAMPPSTPTPAAAQVPQTPPVSPPEPSPEPSIAPETPPSLISGYFAIPESNVRLDIPAGKQTIIIGREDPVSGIFPDIDLDQHSGQDLGVGRRHAQMTLQAGQLLIEDLDSVNGTVVNKQKIPPRTLKPVQDGDEIRLGKLVLIFHSK